MCWPYQRNAIRILDDYWASNRSWDSARLTFANALGCVVAVSDFDVFGWGGRLPARLKNLRFQDC
jgi:hypothetical protein